MELNVKLRLVINTLDGLTVSGRDNMERVVASIQELERIVTALETKPAAEEKGEPNG